MTIHRLWILASLLLFAIIGALEALRVRREGDVPHVLRMVGAFALCVLPPLFELALASSGGRLWDGAMLAIAVIVQLALCLALVVLVALDLRRYRTLRESLRAQIVDFFLRRKNGGVGPSDIVDYLKEVRREDPRRFRQAAERVVGELVQQGLLVCKEG